MMSKLAKFLPKGALDTAVKGEEVKRQPGKLAFTLSGLPPSKMTPVLVFLPGFPDSTESFAVLAERFAATHTLVLTCLPDYEQRETALGGGKLAQRWGYSFDSICDMLRVVIEEVATTTTSAGAKPVTLVVHDWGAFTAYRFCKMYPELVGGMVALDVGFGACQPNPFDVFNLLVLFGYQGWLIFGFILSQLVSAVLGDIFIALYPWKWLGPTPHEYRMPRPVREIHSWMGYPYLQLYCEKILSLGRRPQTVDPTSLGKPLLYLFGKRKRAMFQTQSFLDRIDRRAAAAAAAAAAAGDGNAELGPLVAASRWRGIDGAGHFLQTQKPDEVEAHMRDFFAAIAAIETKMKKRG